MFINIMASPLSSKEFRRFSAVCSKLRAGFAERSMPAMELLFDKLYVAAIRSFNEPVDDVIRSSRKDLRKAMRIDPDDHAIPFANDNMRVGKKLAQLMAFGRRKPMISSNIFVQLIYCIVENVALGSSYGIHSDLELSGVASAWVYRLAPTTEYCYHTVNDGSKPNRYVQGVLLGGRVLLSESTCDMPWMLVDDGSRMVGPERTMYCNVYVNESGLVLCYGAGLQYFTVIDLGPYISGGHNPASLGTLAQSSDAPTMPDVDFISKYHVFYSVINLVLKIKYTEHGVQLIPVRKYRRYFKMYKRYGNKRLCNKVYLETRDENHYNFVWNGEIIYSGCLNGGKWQLHTDGLLYNINYEYVDCVQLHVDFYAEKL